MKGPEVVYKIPPPPGYIIVLTLFVMRVVEREQGWGINNSVTLALTH